jgi:hypothetical protein
MNLKNIVPVHAMNAIAKKARDACSLGFQLPTQNDEVETTPEPLGTERPALQAISGRT